MMTATIGERTGGVVVEACGGAGGEEVVGPSRRPRRPRGSARPPQRVAREVLVRRSEYLPAEAGALVRAYLEWGMTVEEIAELMHMPQRQVRRRLKRLCERLADPCFLMAAQFRDRLPAALAALAQAHWIEDQPLRVLARTGRQTLHRVRQELAKARSLLLVAMSAQTAVSPEQASAALDVRRAAGV